MRVGVIGCGTAGAAAAILLARGGAKVTVLEKVAAPAPVGAGIVVQPSGQAVLARLGLLDAIAAKGARLDRLFLRSHRGRTLADLQYAQVDPAWFGIGLHRGVLFDALYGAACAEPGVDVRCDRDVRALRKNGELVHAIDASGGEHGPFELVVVADGAQSLLRGAGRDTPYPWGALWLVAPDPERAFARELHQVARGARQLYGVLPTGTAPRGDTPMLSIFWSLAARDLDAWRARGLAGWKAEVAALDPRIAPWLDAVTSPDQLTFARYRDVKMARWHDGRVVHLGDAAHATSPQLGQGANLALVDALVLADALAREPALEAALTAYSRERRRHLGYYQRMTRLLTPLFQSDSRVLGWLRDAVFPLANALPPLRRHMVRTMAGVALGFNARRLALQGPDAGRQSSRPGH